jgi:hypothetical protein
MRLRCTQPGDQLPGGNIRVRLDDFLLDVFDLVPEEFAALIREQASDAMHPPLSATAVLDNLAAAGAPETVAELRPIL